MPNVHTTLTSLFTAIANAIRAKKGTSTTIVADDFPGEILTIETELDPLADPASAADILAGKEAYGDDGEVITGTLVPPVDTGANGLYKILVEGTTVPDVVYAPEITRINTDSIRVGPLNLQKAKEIRLPNCDTIGSDKIIFAGGSLYLLELGKNLSIITSSNANMGQGFLIYPNAVSRLLKVIGINTLGGYSGIGLRNVAHLWFCDVVQMKESCMYNAAGIYAQTITFDALASLDGQGNFGLQARSTLSSIIIRTPTLCTLVRAFNQTSDITAQFTKFYVPANLLSQYASATNWTTYYDRGQILGIDEDTTATVGTPFTPTTSVTVDHWDQVDLQSYSTGTVDTTTGTITPTHDGRLLIRGLDANDEIVHVTYLQIGTGFDEEANLA